MISKANTTGDFLATSHLVLQVSFALNIRLYNIYNQQTFLTISIAIFHKGTQSESNNTHRSNL